ncbi:MAG: DUF3043 domain-containing protein, partial [Streptosporangiaceae bacterium]
MFRRRASNAADVLNQGAADQRDDASPAQRPGVSAAKGRPTPKRSESERQRRQPSSGPGDRKATATQGRDRGRADRARRMEAMRRGEDWALPRKDQGPV